MDSDVGGARLRPPINSAYERWTVLNGVPGPRAGTLPTNSRLPANPRLLLWIVEPLSMHATPRHLLQTEVLSSFWKQFGRPVSSPFNKYFHVRIVRLHFAHLRGFPSSSDPKQTDTRSLNVHYHDISTNILYKTPS